VLASQTRDEQADSRAQRAELQRQETLIVNQQDKLLNLRIAEDIDQETFARKSTELRDRLAAIKLQLDVVDRSHDETADLAVKVFELSQTLRENGLRRLLSKAPNPGNRSIELPTRRRKPSPHNKKALRRSRRRACF
jgi:hypothetical protein